MDHAELVARVKELEMRLAAVEDSSSTEGVGNVEGEPSTLLHRRQLLGRAGAMAAGAVAGGVAMVVADAAPAAAAPGTFDGSPAVSATGTGSSGTGVFATSVGGYAVYGSAQSGVGVNGAAPGPGGTGVSGLSGASAGPNGFGVSAGALGQGTGLYVASSSGMTMRFNQTSAAVPLPADSPLWAVPGCVVYNSDGLWFCYENAGGQPNTAKWVRLDAGPVVLPTPKRVYDSRPGQSPAVDPKSPLAGGTSRTINLKAASSGVPTGTSAALLSVTVTGTTTGAGGFLSVYRNGIGWPGTSNVSWSSAGQTLSVTTLAATDAQARVNLYAGSTCDVVVDVLAYYL
jgi:hypothetical protein